MSLEKWKQVPFHTLFRRVGKRTGHGDKQLLSVYRDYGVIIKSDRDDNFNRPGESLDDYQLVNPGDLVLNKMKTWQGSLGVSAYEGIVSPAYFVYEPKGEFDNRYMHHLLRSQDSINYYGAHSKGIRVNQWDLQPEYLNQMKVCLPPLETQQRIADYLDRETAEIDAAVADLDKYVELLEKRKRAVGAALLDEAVKDESTLSVHLGSLGTFLSGSGFPHDYQGIEDEEYPFYKVGSLSTVDRNAVVHDSRNTVSRKTALELGAKVIPNGSVLMAKIGEAMRLCRFAVNATDCCIDNNMMAVVPRFEHITTDYLRLALTLVTVDVLVNPGPVPSLNVQGLRMFSIPLPSLGIQEKLTDEWKKETSEIDSLIADSTRLRDLLLKRRSVLIAEVVTGRKQV